MCTNDLTKARGLLRSAQRVVVLTGAGVSAESGVPTFRGAGGLWKSHRPEDLATPEAFAEDPRLVWEWYGWRRDLVSACEPNPAHLGLAQLCLQRPGRTTIVTQNVDGLHHRAARSVADGSSQDAEEAYPIEVHGAIHRDRCTKCGIRFDGVTVDTTAHETLPRCPRCSGLLRPDVVWFGEALDPSTIGASFAAAQEADLCLVIGTSAVVYPAASVPEVTRQSGGLVIEVNLEPTPLSAYASVSLMGEAGKLVPELVG